MCEPSVRSDNDFILISAQILSPPTERAVANDEVAARRHQLNLFRWRTFPRNERDITTFIKERPCLRNFIREHKEVGIRELCAHHRQSIIIIAFVTNKISIAESVAQVVAQAYIHAYRVTSVYLCKDFGSHIAQRLHRLELFLEYGSYRLKTFRGLTYPEKEHILVFVQVFPSWNTISIEVDSILLKSVPTLLYVTTPAQYPLQFVRTISNDLADCTVRDKEISISYLVG